MQHSIPQRPASYDRRVALVLQGGGALGSYQAGVYAALAESEYLPDWVAGISIGAINAAIIAGNAPEHRVQRLREFWEGITTPLPPWSGAWSGLQASLPPGLFNAPFGDPHRASALRALLCGQPGFFAPWPPSEWLFGAPRISYYDTSALKGTIESLVDFDRINSREMRFSVAAVNVRTGNFAYFDNADIPIRAEHVMASGALPPGFPSIEIDGEAYWDGGLVSNTPLIHVLDAVPRRSRLVFQVDVFSARGPLPQTLEEVQEREKDIRYSSRTRAATNTSKSLHDLRHNINALWDRLPPALREMREAQFLYNFGCVTRMDVAQLIYRPTEGQGYAKDYEFSRATMEARWAQGFSDAMATLEASPWLVPMAPEEGARSFDVLKAAPAAGPRGAAARP